MVSIRTGFLKEHGFYKDRVSIRTAALNGMVNCLLTRYLFIKILNTGNRCQQYFVEIDNKVMVMV